MFENIVTIFVYTIIYFFIFSFFYLFIELAWECIKSGYGPFPKIEKMIDFVKKLF
jgi:hypothetical protein